jgi:hypothetical protein
MLRMPLAAGSHSVELKFKDASGSEVTSRTFDNVEIRPGKKTFLIVRSAS